MSEDFEVLSALLDGDAVDIRLLETALENPEGRRVFVDFVRLRQTAVSDDAPPREFHDRVLGSLTPKRRTWARSVPFPLAAAAVLLAMLFGSILDLDFISQDLNPAAPPEAARVLRFEPGVDWQP
jgi:negative regulator of sigma E activity